MNRVDRLAAVVMSVASASLVAYVPAEAVSVGSYEGWQTVQYDFSDQSHQSGEVISFMSQNAGPAITVSSIAENRKGKEKPSVVTVVEGYGLGIVSGSQDSLALDMWGKRERLQFSFETDYAAKLSAVSLSGVNGHEYVVINDSFASAPGKSNIKFKQYSSTEELDDASFEFEASEGDGFYIKKVIFKLLRQSDALGQYSSTKPHS